MQSIVQLFPTDVGNSLDADVTCSAMAGDPVTNMDGAKAMGWRST